MICERCDHELATPADWYHADGCAHCRGLCWRSTTSEYGVCSHPEIDWRGRALAAEADRDSLAAASENNMAWIATLLNERAAESEQRSVLLTRHAVMTTQSARLAADRDAHAARALELAAARSAMGIERDAYRAMVCDLLKNGVIP